MKASELNGTHLGQHITVTIDHASITDTAPWPQARLRPRPHNNGCSGSTAQGKSPPTNEPRSPSMTEPQQVDSGTSTDPGSGWRPGEVGLCKKVPGGYLMVRDGQRNLGLKAGVDGWEEFKVVPDGD